MQDVPLPFDLHLRTHADEAHASAASPRAVSPDPAAHRLAVIALRQRRKQQARGGRLRGQATSGPPRPAPCRSGRTPLAESDWRVVAAWPRRPPPAWPSPARA